MEGFITVAQAKENLYSICLGRFAYENRLETAGQSHILFNMFLIFINGRSANALQFPTGQGRLENIGRIHGTFDGTGTDELMELVNKEDDRRIVANSFNNLFDTFFKFTAIFRTGNEAGHIEGKDTFPCQYIRYGAIDNALGQAFGNSRLAYARCTNEDRIVFRPAAENLNNPVDLIFPANYRIDFSLPCQFI